MLFSDYILTQKLVKIKYRSKGTMAASDWFT
jgi:hypothetical protein